MIIMLVMVVLFVVSIVVWLIKKNNWDCWGVFPATVGMLLFFAALILAVNRAETYSESLAFRATAETMESERANTDISVIELASIQRDAIDKNGWLASSKYWAKNPWTNWFVHPIVLQLKPIK
jgi:hypothetical protein